MLEQVEHINPHHPDFIPQRTYLHCECSRGEVVHELVSVTLKNNKHRELWACHWCDNVRS